MPAGDVCIAILPVFRISDYSWKLTLRYHRLRMRWKPEDFPRRDQCRQETPEPPRIPNSDFFHLNIFNVWQREKRYSKFNEWIKVMKIWPAVRDWRWMYRAQWPVNVESLKVFTESGTHISWFAQRLSGQRWFEYTFSALVVGIKLAESGWHDSLVENVMEPL